ncbi:MAG: energy-coupling factor ABC transporter ATP-binding protein [Muribaculaceae bacterium]|nr:energy-coupling factor ABC transporter ATP-binding protein [Roseburia sp.]MCM1430893.1 energy-coupling factor ABC transporter ATP-binding protein [Muribaculaceae bacterium]MCM1491746.1 energy-coupling factor ABC transporter ATP-binding protein [Muribaculaceae bacterium]
MIEVSGLTYTYETQRNNPVLKGIRFHVGEGECVGIIGANGAGKSTLLKILVGLLTDYGGSVRVLDCPVEKKRLRELRKSVGYVFQDSDSQLFLSTVYEDVAFGPRNYGYGEPEVEERVMAALRKVHMEELSDRHVYRLSGGQKKLASIATVLSMEPRVLLFDEPTIALDPRNRRNLIRVLGETPGTKVIASHDLDMVQALCSRVLLLDKGEIAYDGEAASALLDNELLEKHGL